LFGIGSYVKNLLTSLEKENIAINYIVDESFLNWKKRIKGIMVHPLSHIQKENPEEIVVLIGTHEIGRILSLLTDFGMMHVFAYFLFFKKTYDEENIESYSVYL
jgi:hypothetical protein